MVKLAAPSCPNVACNYEPAECNPTLEVPEQPDCVCAACPNVTVKPVTCYRTVHTFSSWLDEVASSVYLERQHNGRESWDCDDMAEEQESRIENTLKDVKDARAVCHTIYGELLVEDKWVGHAWVSCDFKGIIFEATDGTIVDPWDYGKYRR